MTATVSQPTQANAAADISAKGENGTSNVASSQDVGLIFVREYYTFLNKKPQRLYAFYGKDSLLVRGDEGETVQTYHGQEEIRKKIDEIGFEDCKVLVTQLDSQLSANNGIIIQVLGEMCNKDGPSQKFSQTFFLAPQHNGYYVLNDMFRFLKDEVNIDYYTCEEEEDQYVQKQQQPPTPAPQKKDEKPAVTQAPAEETPAPPTPPKDEKYVTEKPAVQKAEEEETKTVKPKAVETKLKATETPKSGAEKTVETVASEPEKEPDVSVTEKRPESSKKEQKPAAQPSPKQDQQPKQNTTESTQQQTEKPVKPAAKTWANLAANDSDKWGAQVAETKGPVASVPATQPKHQPQQQQQQQQQAQVPAGQQPFQQTHGQGHGHGHRGDQRKAAEETTQIFVKNVGPHILEEHLREAFAHFGTVKAVNVMHNRNCAFLDFTTPEACQKALNQHKVNIGNHVVLAEERRHGGGRHQYGRQQQNNRPFERRFQQDGGHRRGGGGGAGSRGGANVGKTRGGGQK